MFFVETRHAVSLQKKSNRQNNLSIFVNMPLHHDKKLLSEKYDSLSIIVLNNTKFNKFEIGRFSGRIRYKRAF